MKAFLVGLVLVASVGAQAGVVATEAFNKLYPTGTYTGKNNSGACSVTVNVSGDVVVVSIDEKNGHQAFGIHNQGNYYSINEVTGEIAATINSNFPKYSYGGSKHLLIRSQNENQTEFYISEILLDHRGEDASTFTSCVISK